MAIATMMSRLKLAKFFFDQRIIGFDPPDTPFFDAASTSPFTKLLENAKQYLEFGSGGSTILAGRLGIDTITVENDRFFAKAVMKKLSPSAKNHMIVPYVGLTQHWGYPLFTKHTPRRLARWRSYVDAPFEYLQHATAQFPDLILVDGRFRRACALASCMHAQRAGAKTTICVDDYSGRPEYISLEHKLGKPIMHGRMAMFHVDSSTTLVTSEVVFDACKDFR
jgi:hypothetical protein